MVATGSIYLIADLVARPGAGARLDAVKRRRRTAFLAMIGARGASSSPLVILVFFGIGYRSGGCSSSGHRRAACTLLHSPPR